VIGRGAGNAAYTSNPPELGRRSKRRVEVRDEVVEALGRDVDEGLRACSDGATEIDGATHDVALCKGTWIALQRHLRPEGEGPAAIVPRPEALDLRVDAWGVRSLSVVRGQHPIPRSVEARLEGLTPSTPPVASWCGATSFAVSTLSVKTRASTTSPSTIGVSELGFTLGANWMSSS